MDMKASVDVCMHESRPAALTGVVEWIWDWQERVPRPFSLERLMPSASPRMIFNRGEAHVRHYDAALRPVTLSSAVFVGPHTRAAIIDTREQNAVSCITLHPGAAASFLGVPMDALVDLHVDLHALIGSEAERVLDQLRCACSGAARVALLERWALHHWVKRSNARIQRASSRALATEGLRRLSRAPCLHTLQQFANESGCSDRTLRDAFRAEVGMTPKRYLRLERFLAVLREVPLRGCVDWAAVAADAGFSDQAHLTHEFRRFSGTTPAHWQSIRGPYLDHVPLD